MVEKDAQKTDSNQSNKNILLSKNARMNSNPQLVINADDVKCSHGSSTGEIDQDALFYLRSRGIDYKTAKSILIHGFVSEIFDSADNLEIINYIKSDFDKWIEN
jgi:Fe-S cluster assembly protein SufD